MRREAVRGDDTRATLRRYLTENGISLKTLNDQTDKNVDIGKLYDQNIAGTYDQDRLGLLSGGREMAVQQFKAQIAQSGVREVLDLAVGTGESLLKVHGLFPAANMHGIDLSSEMLEIAKAKLPFNPIHDDVAHARQHFPPACMDLMLMHFLTTFVDGNEVVQDTAKLLRSGGYYSIVSTTYEAFPRIHELSRMVLSDDFIKQASPAPMNIEVVASYLSNAGLEIVAQGTFAKSVKFFDFNEFYRFGMDSGFFTHILVQMDRAQIEQAGRMPNVFPLEDQYKAAVVLARKP